MNKDKVVLSLFDYSGEWSAPYKKAGYSVYQVDKKLGIDITDAVESVIEDMVAHPKGKIVCHGILAAPPCTKFAGSGARWWKDRDNEEADWNHPYKFDTWLEYYIFMVDCILILDDFLTPEFIAIENPVGRMPKLIPDLEKRYGKPYYWNPCDFGDPYTKKTGLWGRFKIPHPTPVLPIFGSMMQQKYGGKSERTKTMRSITPKGFAQAFFEANK